MPSVHLHSDPGRGRQEAPPSPARALQSRLVKYVFRPATHLLLDTRPWIRRNLAEFAQGLGGRRILEIGSGRQDQGHDAYSFRELFDSSNEFVQSDVVPEYGHELVDVRAIGRVEAFDVILCLYVLEHVFELEDAVRSMHGALTPGGTLVVAVPHLYPYHDEPTDYWRFTEHALRQMLEAFESTEIRVRGLRRMPVALLAFARKADAA